MDELQTILDNDNHFLADYLASIDGTQSVMDERDPDEVDDFYEVESEDPDEEMSSIFDDNYEEGISDDFNSFSTNIEENKDSDNLMLDYLLGNSSPYVNDNESIMPTTRGAISVKDAIVNNESGGRYDVVNPGSSATGKYQFIWSIWKNKIGVVTGVKTKEQFLNNPQAQDAFYDWYEKNEMAPAVNRLQQYNNQNLTPTQLGRLFHYRGEGGAKAYLQGKVSDKPEANNPSISKYLAKYKQAGGSGAINMLPPVEVSAKMPKWKKYSVQFDRFMPKSDILNEYLDPLARSLGNSRDNYPERIDKEYDQQKNDYIARGLILDRNNDTYTDKEKEIINSSKYKGMKKEDVYNDPIHFNIHTGDRSADLLYDNSYLMKVPGSRQLIQKIARTYVTDADADGGAVSEGSLLDKYKERQLDDPLEFNPVSQFLLKNQNLDEAKYKPLNDYYEFLPAYSIKSKAGINPKINDFLKKYATPETMDSIKKSPIYINDENIKNPPVYQNLTNLGKYKSGIAYDAEKNLPYYFVADAWDFEPQSYSSDWTFGNSSKHMTPKDIQKSYQQSYLLNKAGNPFKIYDRFYFNPKTGEYIDENSSKKQAGGVPVATTDYEQYIGLNDDSLQELLLPLNGYNTIRGLDSGEPVEIVDSKGKRKILRGAKDKTVTQGKVYEKRLSNQ